MSEIEEIEKIIYDELKRQYKGRLPPRLRISDLAKALSGKIAKETEDSRLLPCKHLYFKIENSKLVELNIDGEEWIRAKPETRKSKSPRLCGQETYRNY